LAYNNLIRHARKNRFKKGKVAGPPENLAMFEQDSGGHSTGG
jgi:hypothetical protein